MSLGYVTIYVYTFLEAKTLPFYFFFFFFSFHILLNNIYIFHEVVCDCVFFNYGFWVTSINFTSLENAEMLSF